MSDALSSQPISLPSDPTTSTQAATKAYVDSNTADKVSRTGDTMLASLFLAVAADPAPTEAVDRQWVEAAIASGADGTLTADNVVVTPAGGVVATDVQAAIEELDSEKVNKSGDTMTGFLTLHANPTLALQAATKQYVDTFGTKIIAQPDPLATWTITHNLNRYPSVTVVDSAKQVVVGDCVYTNANTVTIYFAAAFSGTVYLN